jgi:hypothetical protein
MSSLIAVEPTILYDNPPVICSFSYNVNSFILKTIISFNVILLDKNNKILKIELITLEGDDYTKWGYDDNYVINYICSKLHLSQSVVYPIAESPVVTVEESPVVTVEESPVVTVE